jgi:ABC-2 type transport system permease protein
MTTTLRLFTANLKMLVRDRQVLLGATLFPIIFVVAFSLFDLGLGGSTLGSGGGADYFDFVLPGVIAMGAMQFAILWTASTISRYRELGILRRLEATPLRRAPFVGGQVLARILVIGAQAALVLGVGVLLGATIRGNWIWIVLLAVLGGVTFLSLGFVVGSRASNPDSAGMMAAMITMPLIFLSGGWLPLESLPSGLQSVVEWLPLAPLLRAMREVSLAGASLGDVAGDLVIVIAWIPVLFLLARTTFRFGRRAA